MPSLPKKRRWTLRTALVSGPTQIHTRFRTWTTGNWTGTIQWFTFFLGSRVISPPCFLRTSWMPQCGRAKSLKWNQVPPVLSTPATMSSCGTYSRTSSGSKLQCNCQLWQPFLDHLRLLQVPWKWPPDSLVEDAITCNSGFTSPAESSVAASVSLEPSAPSRLSAFRPWQASTSTFADEFIQHSTATQDPAVSTSLPIVSAVTHASSDASVSVVAATLIVSSISTSSSKETTVKTDTRTDAKPIVEEEDLITQLLGNDAGPLDRDQEARPCH